MSELTCTLLCDGSSDRALIPVLRWLLREKLPTRTQKWEWADIGRLRKPPKTLSGKIKSAAELYPCHVLFVHRDAEGETFKHRLEEIALAKFGSGITSNVAPVIPVRMQEAWLLLEKDAIRGAAGNPNGRLPLELPRLDKLESLEDPKATLHDLLKNACELTGRRLRKFNLSVSAARVAELISDWAPLRKLSVFRQLETTIDQLLPLVLPSDDNS